MTLHDRAECGVEQPKRGGLNHSHDIYNPKIINGQHADPYQYPWLVYIEINEYPLVSECTGAIINDRYIATAAHCVQSEDIEPDDVLVWNGPICDKDDLKNTTPLEVKRIIKHDKYRGVLTYHDIALLELETPLVFNETFTPICLPNFSRFSNFFASGWGLVNLDFPGLETSLIQATCLMEAELTPRFWTACKSLYGLRVPTSQILCAGGKTNVCQGDSGGPLMSRKFGRVYSAGITSHGKSDCGVITQYPSVFEKITFHRDWILEKTVNAKWCDGPAQLID